jgi:hypothetical protein
MVSVAVVAYMGISYYVNTSGSFDLAIIGHGLLNYSTFLIAVIALLRK